MGLPRTEILILQLLYQGKILMRKFELFTNLKATVHGQSPQTMSSADKSENLIDNVV